MPENFSQHNIDLLQYIIVPEAQHTKSVFTQDFGALRIIHGMISMLATVDFNYQRSFQTGKVHDIPADWKLPAELKVEQPPATQMLSQESFRISGGAT